MPAAPTPKPPAHLKGKVSLADIHCGLAVVGIQVEQEIICGGLGAAVTGEGKKAEGCDPGRDGAYPGSQ